MSEREEALRQVAESFIAFAEEMRLNNPGLLFREREHLKGLAQRALARAADSGGVRAGTEETNSRNGERDRQLRAFRGTGRNVERDTQVGT